MPPSRPPGAKGGTAAGEAAGAAKGTANKIKLIEQDGITHEFSISRPSGNLSVVTDVVKNDNQLILNGLHIDGPGAGVSSLSELRDFARTLGKQYGVDEVVINGGVRTSGANPGKTPRSITIKVNP